MLIRGGMSASGWKGHVAQFMINYCTLIPPFGSLSSPRLLLLAWSRPLVGDEIRHHGNGNARQGTPIVVDYESTHENSANSAPQRVNTVRDCVLEARAISGRIVPHTSLLLVSISFSIWLGPCFL
jgi:hypothetical protein